MFTPSFHRTCLGDPGEDGTDGVPGVDGTDGVPGPKGKHLDQVLHFLSSFPSTHSSGMHVVLSPSFHRTCLGDSGDDGTDGSPGDDGRDGVPGDDGRDGVPGDDGRDGNPGSKGRQLIRQRPSLINELCKWLLPL